MTTVERSPDLTEAVPRSARLAVATIFFTNGLGLANWLTRIPDVKQQLALSNKTLGLVLLCTAIGALLAQPTTGLLIRKFGSQRVTMLLAIGFFAVISLPGWASSVGALMLALFVLGAFNGALDVAMNAQAALVEQRYARPIMSSFHGLWSVGGLLGAALGGLATTMQLTVGVHLLLVSILSLAIGLLATRWLIADAGHGGASDEPVFALPPRALLTLGLIAFGVLLCEGAIADWSAVYLRDTLGTTAGLAATGYAVFALLMAIGRLTGDRLTLWLGPARLVRGGGLLVTLGILLTLVSNLPLLAIAGFGLIGAGVTCVFPLILSAAARTPRIAPSTGIAAMATAGYTGFLAGPPLIGTLAEAVTLRGALGLLGLIGVLLVLFGGAVQPEA